MKLFAAIDPKSQGALKTARSAGEKRNAKNHAAFVRKCASDPNPKVRIWAIKQLPKSNKPFSKLRVE